MRNRLCIGIVLALFGVMSAIAAENVRIMSYNVRNARGLDNVRDVDRISAVIERARPTVVAVQELDSMTRRSSNTYVLGEIAMRTGMYATYAPAIDYQGGKYGIGILSKHRPLRVRTIPLPGREEARMLVVADFENYRFCCTHVSLTEEDQLASIDIISSVADDDKPLFIAGDMNALPGSPFIEKFSNTFKILNDTTKFTFPANNPTITIDYIAVAATPEQCYAVTKTQVIEEPVASDHRPLVVDVVLGKNPDKLMVTRPYLQNPVANGMTVMWETAVPTYSWVEFGTDTLHMQRARVLVDGQAEFTKKVHKIRLENLKPATRYYYRACSQEIPVYRAYHKTMGPVVKSEIYSFVTPDPKADSFRAVVFNDLHQHGETFEALCQQIKDVDYDFAVFNGDCVADPKNHEQVTRFIKQLAEGVGGESKPVFFLRGNHEIRNAYSVGLRDHYDYVDGKTYSAFNWGDTRMVLLDCGEDKPDEHPVYYGLNDFSQLRKEQAEFLKQELNSKAFKKADKRVLIHHIPMYGNRGKNLCEDLWKPLLDKAPFDLSINAHIHKHTYHPKGTVGNNYPVVTGGGPSLKDATVMILTKSKGKLNLRVLDVRGKELLNVTE